MSPALTVTEDEMATALRIFGESVTEVAAPVAALGREARAAGALHEGKVGG
jgi:hypothetical protein